MPEAAPIGLLGGTFDPVHHGHLRLAEEAREALALQEVRWIPAGQPPHRQPPRADAAHRLEMVRLAIAGNPHFALDAAEAQAAGPGYTVPTLERLCAAEGGRPLVLLMGADVFRGLEAWHRWRELFDLAHIGVATRPGFAIDPADMPPDLAAACRGRLADDPGALRAASAGRVVAFTMTPLAISASLLRARLAAGLSARYLLPDAVGEYIQTHRLYRSPDGR
ncbi:MAG: nicotinate-nucleotide adenylyltransferase [Betaproteobacteria bacterium]|nr:nicotinate-nucleotide adenylyltransferase [Betaproteobacteria bacterium]